MGDGRVISLPWPPRELSPNARVHHHEKARHAKLYRTSAYWLTEQANPPTPAAGEILLAVTFYPPDKRRRDLDGMFSSIKAGLDGIADALRVDDYRFAFLIRRADPLNKLGAVSVAVVPTQ